LSLELSKVLKIVKKVGFFGFLSIFCEKFDFLGVFEKGQKRVIFDQKRAFFDPFLNA